MEVDGVDGLGFDPEFDRRYAEHVAMSERLNFLAVAEARHHADNWDAYMVETLRDLGRQTGRRRHYERQARGYLRRRGY